MDGRKLTRNMGYTCLLLLIFGSFCWASPVQLSNAQKNAIQAQIAQSQEQTRRMALEGAGEIFKNTCANGADQEIRQQLLASFGEMLSCTELRPSDVESLLEATDILRRSADLTCEKYISSKPCFAKFIQSLEICEMPVKIPLGDLKGAVYEMIDYTCSGSSSRLQGLMGELSPTCAQGLEKEMDSCLENFLSVNTFENFTWNATGCRLVKEVQECVGSRIKSCGGAKTAELVDGVFDIILRRLPCGHSGDGMRFTTAAADTEIGRFEGAAAPPASNVSTASTVPAATFALLALLANCLLGRRSLF